MSAHWNYISRKFINKTAQLFAQSRLCQAQSLMKNTWLDEKLHYFINKLSGAVISMCVLTSLFSFIDFFCPTHEPNLGFGCAHLCIFLYFLCIQKQLSISSSWSINKLKTNMCIRLHMWWCCLSLFPLLAGPLVASWCQQLFIESRCHIRYLCQLGTPPLLATAAQLIRKHCCQGKAWWSRRGEICCPCG